jgi:hypothetical protein
MDTMQITSKKQLKKDACFSADELESMGVFPTDLQCFSYFNYLLFRQGNKRIIVKPLPHYLFKVLRIYDFMPA